MSRTDKDLPYWIADEYQEDHDLRCATGRCECDLPENPENLNRRPFTECYWRPIHPRSRYPNFLASPPRWYVRHVWYGPERVRERVVLGAAKKDYNANGSTEIDFANYQHRHNGWWLWT